MEFFGTVARAMGASEAARAMEASEAARAEKADHC